MLINLCVENKKFPDFDVTQYKKGLKIKVSRLLEPCGCLMPIMVKYDPTYDYDLFCALPYKVICSHCNHVWEKRGNLALADHHVGDINTFIRNFKMGLGS